MSGDTTDILLFQVGARVFASVVFDAVRIGSVRDIPAGELVVGSALGMPFARERGIVVASPEDALERVLVVDQVLGVRSVPDADLHPLPAFAAACLTSGAVTGFVLLVDLPTLVREHPGAAPQRAA